MSKAELRVKYKKLRAGISEQERQNLDRAIFNRCLKAVDWRKIKSLHIYQSKKHEADTSQLIDYLKKEQPQIKITHPDEQGENERFDGIVVPVIAFDANGYRLGYGGGYYDKFLATQPQALKVGLAYENAFVPDGLAHEPHDVPLDLIITEKQVYS